MKPLDLSRLLHPVTVTRPMKENYNEDIDSYTAKEEFEKERLALKANILYVHGFASSGNSGTAQTLQKMLPESKVVAPDLPIDPREALSLLKKLIIEENIDIVVGTSMGGMFAQQMRGVPKVIVNPSFHVSESMRGKIGKVRYFKAREDGSTEFEVTEQLCENYQDIEAHQFENIDEREKKITYGLFGIDDDVVNCESEYRKYYPNTMFFGGGHRLDENAIYNYVVEAILLLNKD